MGKVIKKIFEDFGTLEQLLLFSEGQRTLQASKNVINLKDNPGRYKSYLEGVNKKLIPTAMGLINFKPNRTCVFRED